VCLHRTKGFFADKSTRSERENIPSLLRTTASDSDWKIRESEIGYTEGFFEDGAYVVCSDPSPELNIESDQGFDPQHAFTVSLKDRFFALRERLCEEATLDNPLTTNQEYHIAFLRFDKKSRKTWLEILQSTAPVVDQVRQMDETTVLNLLLLIQQQFLLRGTDISQSVSVWIWSLLARAKEAGMMNNSEVDTVRELGKRALIVQLSFSDPESALHLELAGIQDRGVQTVGDERTKRETALRPGEDHSGDQQAASRPTSGDLEATHPDESASKIAVDGDVSQREATLATLDMIVVIVGDVYGQRDILEFRQSWPSGPSSDET
jgi:hypothetical protein